MDRSKKTRQLGPKTSNAGAQANSQSPTAAHEAGELTTSFTPTELVMNEIRHSIERCKDKYLESLMVAMDKGLPPTVVIEIEKEVRMQLDRKSREILNDVIGGKANHSGHVTYLYESVPDACSASRLEADFRVILRAFNESQGSYIQMSRMVDEFCYTLLNTIELRQEIEPLVALLVTYANARLGNAQRSNK